MLGYMEHKQLIPKDHNPFEDAGWFSRLLFNWMTPLIRLGASKPLDASDIPPVPKAFSAEVVLAKFESAWREEVKNRGDKANAGTALFNAFKDDMYSSAFCFGPYVITILMQPYLINDLLTFITGENKYFFQVKEGISLAILFGIVSLINLLSASVSFYLVSKSAMAMKVATISAVFAKSLRLSSAAKSKHTTGEKVTLISADAERVWYGMIFVNWVWAGPLLMIVSMVLLIVYVGWAAVAALAVMLIMTLVQLYIGKQVGAVRKEQLKYTDERTKVINESLQGIRILKYYAWESATAHRIEQLRKEEVKQLTRFHMLKMLNTYIMFAAPVIVPFTLFVVYLRLGGELSVSKVYTMYALLSVIRLPFSITPMAWASYNEARIAFDRISKFLLLDEHEDKLLEGESSDEAAPPLLKITGATFTYDVNSTEGFHLRDIDFAIYPGDFIAVVGSVGSGKSSFIGAILGEMVCIEGDLQNNARIAYVAQEHWICNTKLMDNVLFYSPYNETCYKQTMDDSQLVNDLLVLPHADHTSIGERGVNLSGGQKARVSIARALYAGYHFNLSGHKSDSNLSAMAKINTSAEIDTPTNKEIDLYIFDDALASVDIHVGKALFNHAINSDHIKDKARVVSLSSNYHLLPYFDKIVVLNNGRIEKMGTFEQIRKQYKEYDVVQRNREYYTANSFKLPPDISLENEDEDNNEVVESKVDAPKDAASEDKSELDDESKVVVIKDILVTEANEQKMPQQSKSVRFEQEETIAAKKGSKFVLHEQTIIERREKATNILSVEEREKGAVAMKTYFAYFSFALAFFRKHSVRTGSKAEDSARSSTTSSSFQTVNYHFTEENGHIVQNMSDTKPEVENRAGKESFDATEVYKAKDLAIGMVVTLFIFLLFSVSQGIRIVADLWMGIYATRVESGSVSDHTFYKNMFTILTWVTVGISIIRSTIFVLICLGSSYNLHNLLLINVFNAPVNKYFDITPMGRILNRFSKDFDSMDALLPDFFHLTMQNGFFVLSILVVCLMSSPFFVLLFLPLGIAFYYIQSFFRKASREMKRLDNISRSPIYSLYSEILSGLVTIKAFRYVPVFTQKFYSLIDQNIGNFFVLWYAARWLAIRLDLISNFVSFFVALLAVILKLTNQNINSNFVGIALVYSVQLTALLQWTVRISIDTETNMTSVERLMYFNQIPPEQIITKSYEARLSNDKQIRPLEIVADEEKGSIRSSTKDVKKVLRSYPLQELHHWPSVGQITLSNVFMKYRADLPYVLNGVNLTISGGSKVGICGRTAAGKSSLMMTLFRIVECDDSSDILIDGVNIQSVPLYILRSQITIIPQEPFMFSGTLRDNLDPFHQYSDEAISEALDRVELLEDVKTKFANGLDYSISERGENISVGQRQLVCIARALLRKSKVIVMDEATASVDSVTDNKIQQTIREQFKHCTVLTIAHRLETIADYDIVVVMQQGKVAEVGSPLDLLQEKEETGLFRGFVEELGPERKAAFLEVAEKRRQHAVSSSL